ncbi:MAG: hypothetical protein ACLFUH_10410, partial [Bacteroidales bacterium]
MKFNSRKKGFDEGIIAGQKTSTAGKYSDYELLRRVTLTNLLFESNFYQSSDKIMDQIELLVPKVTGEQMISLIYECRFEQKLRHTPLWLIILTNEYHKDINVRHAVKSVCNRPDMLIDLLLMLKARRGKIKPIPKVIKKGMADAFSNYDEYQIAKYKKSNMEISLVDVVNLVHPVPVKANRTALRRLVFGTLEAPNTWESALSSGADKKETIERMIDEGSLGSLA